MVVDAQHTATITLLNTARDCTRIEPENTRHGEEVQPAKPSLLQPALSDGSQILPFPFMVLKFMPDVQPISTGFLLFNSMWAILTPPSDPCNPAPGLV